MIYAIIAVVALLAGGVLRLFSRGRGENTVPIIDPVLGIASFQGESARRWVDEDRAALAPLFAQVHETVGAVPRCDVLFLYCAIGPDGRIGGTAAGLRGLIRDSGAKIVVVASENPVGAYTAAGAPTVPAAFANLVMTLDRKGSAFPSFFARLFADMFTGTSMPLAWVKLAPQIPGHVHPGAPEAIFAAERGQLAFRRA